VEETQLEQILILVQIILDLAVAEQEELQEMFQLQQLQQMEE
jgi:hypothetical protein